MNSIAHSVLHLALVSIQENKNSRSYSKILETKRVARVIDILRYIDDFIEVSVS